MRNGLSGLQIGQSLPRNDDDDDEVSTPIKPSAKALGKRKVVEVEEPDRQFFSFSVGIAISLNPNLRRI